MIHDTLNTHTIRHTMPHLNNSCTTLTAYNMHTAQKLQYSKHNSQYVYRQYYTTDKEHNTTQNTCRAECTSSIVHARSMTYMARCTSNKICDLQHIIHEVTMLYLHTTE